MNLPIVHGDLDASYVRTALARAGIHEPAGDLHTVAMNPEGRSGAKVAGLRIAGRRLVHKAIKDDVGFRAALSGLPGGEGELWASGVTRDLPAPLTWPVLDAVRHAERGETWLLMDDVSEGILRPGDYDAGKLDRMLAGVAKLHARHWGHDDQLARMPLLDLSAVARLFAEPIASCGGSSVPATAWTRWMIDSFVIGRYLPKFLEMVGPAAADDYLRMVECRGPWLRALAEHEPTFLHNDLRRANLAYLPDGRVALLDWERAARGPAAVDLAWLWFLQFWAYPPARPHDPDAHRAAYLARLEEALGRSVDRSRFESSWGLAWVLVMSEVGFLLADVVVESKGASLDEIARRTAVARRALALALDVAQRHS